MNIADYKHLDNILLQVNKPARYTGGEFGSYRKYGCPLNMAISYPDLYEIGMSNTALKVLYNIFNGIDGVNCERVFAPAPDFEEKLREAKIPLYTLETGIPLKKLDIIAFTIGYELTGTNVLNIVDMGGIPLEAEERGDDDPIVIAGGPGVTNPEPFGKIFDAVFIGEAEDAYEPLLEEVINIKKRGGKRSEILALFESKSFIWTQNKKERVHRAIWSDFGKRVYPAARGPVPSIKAIQNNGVVEIMRGCPNGCRFCHAGIYYRPQREKDIELILKEIDTLVHTYGYREITLLSLSSGDYSVMPRLITYLNKKYASYGVSFAFPSLKVSSFSLNLLSGLNEVRKSGLTFAVETPLPQWQADMNKVATIESIVEIIREAKKLGWRVAKFYFMIGLPVSGGGCEEKEIVDFILQVYNQTRIQLNINVGTFVPKPHTPFQYAAQLTEEESWKKLSYIKDSLRGHPIKVSYHSPFLSYLEGIFSRGDGRASDLLIKAFKMGTRLDAWDEYSRLDVWKQVLAEADWDVQDEVCRQREPDEPLPWDNVSMGISSSFFKNEWQRLGTNTFTPICGPDCDHNCGICGTKTTVRNIDQNVEFPPLPPEEPIPEGISRIYFVFAKRSEQIFLGHLDLMGMMEKSIQRAGFFIEFSQGFNPKPRLEFAHPLSLGIVSEGEIASINIHGTTDAQTFIQNMNRSLPWGLEIKEAYVVPKEVYKAKKIQSLMSLYSGSQYTLEYTCDDIAGFQANLAKYIAENELADYISAQRNGNSFDIDIKAGNKKANMMAMLKEVFESDYPLEWCKITRNRLMCSPKPGERLPYQEYFKTI